MNEITKATIEANKVVKEIQNDVLSNIEKFDSMDLKLHDVSYYIYKDMKNDFPLCYKEMQENDTDYFSWYCKNEYLFFEEWAEEEGINLSEIMYYVGRSSSFYLHDRNTISFSNRSKNNVNGIEWQYLTQYLIETFTGSSHLECMIGCDGLLKITNNDIDIIANDFFDDTMTDDYKSDIIDDILTDLEFLIEDAKKSWAAYSDDIYKVAEYIIYFKSNQIENFKNFLKHNENELKSDLIYKEKRENAKKEVLKNVKNIINDDILKFDGFTFKIKLI